MRWLVSGACVWALMAATPSSAQETIAPVYTEISGSQLAAIMQEEGYRADLSEDSYGDPLIDSSVGKSIFQIEFYNCQLGTQGYCEDVMFRISYSLPSGIELETINAWNEGKRFTRAFRDQDFDPVMEYDLDFAGGVTRTHVVKSLRLWESLVTDFEAHIGW